MISSEIIADSLNPQGCRLTTFILEYPRFIHAEILTHRMFSKNAASSRAIPIEKMIQQVIDNPAMPVWWGKNQSGMQADEELDDIKKTQIVSEENYQQLQQYITNIEKFHDGVYYTYELTEKGLVQYNWLLARDKVIYYVQKLNELGLHKQIANRLLEPWFNIRIILSGTEFENFFALRAHKDAQPELQVLANLMLEQYNKSEPEKLKEGEFHIPFGGKILNERLNHIVYSYNETDLTKRVELKTNLAIKIAIARCARISYLNYEGKDDYEADIKLCDRLFGSVPRHLSPTEHVAMAMDNSDFIANFRGFKQYRYFFNDQNLKDERVIKKV